MEGYYINDLLNFYKSLKFVILMNKTTILNNHIDFKKTSVKSTEKIKDTERYLKKFLNSSKKPLSQFKEEDVVKFLNSLDYSVRTINGIKFYIKVFIKWNYPDWSSRFRNLDKICKMETPTRAYEPEQMISFKEIKKIVNFEKDLMWKVYWNVFFYGGFRPSEACRLEWKQISFEPQGVIIKLHTTKTKKDFYKSLPSEVEHLLKEWKKYNSSRFLFPSPLKEDSPIVARSVCARLKRNSIKALGKEVVPYALRHSIATLLYADDTRKDDDTANQLGHNKSMKGTYMNLDEGKLKAQARKLWIKTKPIVQLNDDEITDLKKEMENMKKVIKNIASNREKTKGMNATERLQFLHNS